ncbi:MAG: glycosyltransferase family 9 protein [Alphaproteobacteria bacterium]|nr:MAG: glycosyltransferase family 9 protein [Alphaproteobacteria bacterium]
MSRETILVIRLGALGDIVMAAQAFQDIRRHHADAHIVLLTRRPFAGFARTMPWFDDVMVDPYPRWSPMKWLKLRRMLRALAPDRVYDLQAKARTQRYANLLPAHPRPFWSRPVKDATALHVRDIWARQLRAAGVAASEAVDWDWCQASLNEFPLPQDYVVLIPGCSAHLTRKRWPSRCYAALARRLFEGRGWTSVLVGTNADQEAVQGIIKLIPSALDICGRTSLAQLAELARGARAVIGNDTGPAHLAAAIGAPSLLLLSGHTDPARSAPRGAGAAWLKREHLTALSVDEVEQAVRALTAEKA